MIAIRSWTATPKNLLPQLACLHPFAETALDSHLHRLKQVPKHGVTARIIDFTASRVTVGSAMHTEAFCDLSADPELFEGEAP